MKKNEATWDRTTRIALGLALLVLGFGGIVDGTLGTVFKFLGFVPLATGLIGWCPLYALFGASTCPADRRVSAEDRTPRVVG